ncbi:OB-fold-containig protein [Oryzibacter oryziterrae]|uniref:OB-fold-containig protein n=1 Tax=Oryzibacter oryziterrae TaxID=2766474 RepID=UPI001F17ECB0|nr:OB-fold-containig protein [Oryzibacter oryziterrae]
MDILISQPFQPFAIAAGVLMALVLIEMVGTFAGSAPSHWFGADGIDFAEGTLGWLNAGRVPLLILIMLALGVFAATGYVLQGLALSFSGPMPQSIATFASAVVTIPVVRASGQMLGRFWPRDESYALDDGDFIGKDGVVTVGPLTGAYVGRVRVVDPFGNTHYLRVRPDDGFDDIAVGTQVRITTSQGREFRVKPITD